MNEPYRGADLFKDLKSKDHSPWRIIMEPMILDRGNSLEFEETLRQAKEVRRLYKKQQQKIE
jgi:hypothetical protein